MSQGEAYWAVLEPAWDSVSIYDGPARFQREFEAASVTARNLLAAHWCQSEVCNGGFHQFFKNSTGVLAPEAVAAFHALGLPELAATVAQAIAWFGPTYPRDREPRKQVLSAYASSHPDAWNAFDE